MDFDLSLENELHLVNEQLLPPPLNSTLPLFGHENPDLLSNFRDGSIPKLEERVVDRWKLFFADVVGELLTSNFFFESIEGFVEGSRRIPNWGISLSSSRKDGEWWKTNFVGLFERRGDSIDEITLSKIKRCKRIIPISK